LSCRYHPRAAMRRETVPLPAWRAAETDRTERTMLRCTAPACPTVAEEFDADRVERRHCVQCGADPGKYLKCRKCRRKQEAYDAKRRARIAAQRESHERT
jgi:hypothetical protein